MLFTLKLTSVLHIELGHRSLYLRIGRRDWWIGSV